ncbi:hypothetical protein [Emticicia soli]|uniref:Tetratricopeptide repeat protein n=1 Tax=Emticicia soli TaxID=2027878 RepID=A0ABW5JD62_9BACT
MKNVLLTLIGLLFITKVLAHRTAVDIMDTEAAKVMALIKIGGETGKYINLQEGLKLLEEAAVSAKKIKNKHYREVAQASLAVEYAALDKVDEALKITLSLKDEHLYSTNLGKIASKLTQSNPKEADRLLLLAIDKIMSNKHKNEIPPVFAELSGKYVKLKNLEKANELLNKALKRVELLNKIPLIEKLQIYAEIGANLIAANRKEEAFALFKKSHQLSSKLENPFEKAAILVMIGGELAEKGEPTYALEILQEAYTTAKEIKFIKQKNDVISEIARNFSQAKDYERASAIALEISDSYYVVEGLIRTAKNQIKVKQYNAAFDLLQICINKTNEITDKQRKALVIAKIAAELATIDKQVQSAQLLKDAYKVLG